jgi:hypothetical protein
MSCKCSQGWKNSLLFTGVVHPELEVIEGYTTSRGGCIMEILVNCLAAAIKAFRIGRVCDTRGRANRANDGHLLESFIYALEAMG